MELIIGILAVCFVIHIYREKRRRHGLEIEVEVLKWVLIDKGVVKAEDLENAAQELVDSGKLPAHELNKLLDNSDND